ncbi:hypothetical protein BS47DRAFT_1387999 [Hydnum rufescens UP504]|uniref:Uncharacterized protein n=1 Tax=Hydnum rufescens UP504 TaxID=1448309 RepID=A0A9P6B9H7_9AGAM|nr:hypothetical protein BS47DRAFT_1387999 [Hydnum rufescens UP504]
MPDSPGGTAKISFVRHLLARRTQSKDDEASSPTLSVEAMFQQIMTAVHESSVKVREKIQGRTTLPSHVGLFAPSRPSSPSPGHLSKSGPLFGPTAPPDMWIPIVPAGGFGSHLWPLSREGTQNSSPHKSGVAVGVQSQLPELQHHNLLGEPSLKDSVACHWPPALVLARRDPTLTAVTDAVVTARHDYLVTIGVAPSHPATGFRYIQL